VDDYTLQALQAGLAVYQVIQREIDALEQTAYQAVKLTEVFKILQTITGIGKILGLTIMLETGTIDRFAGAGNFASYCRCVDSKHTSNGKQKGQGNAKAGTNISPGPSLRRRILRYALSHWHNVFMSEKRPKRMALSPSGPSPGSWQEQAG
jgi:transposase